MKTFLSSLKRIPWLIPLLIFAVFVILSARMHPLWGDEAETALFGRNILRYGLPRGWDGVNIMGINNAVVLDKNLLNHTSPWAQYYLVAASFALFGQSSFTARLPSILISFFTIPLAYYLVKKITSDKKMAILSTILLSLSVQYILFAFQARYYILTAFCGLLFVYANFHLTQKHLRWKILFVISALLLFYANYVAFVAFYMSVFISFLIYFFIQKRALRFCIQYLILSIFVVLFTFPWFLLLHPLGDRGSIGIHQSQDMIATFLIYVKECFEPYNISNAFPLLMVLLFFLCIIIRIIRRKPISQILLLFFIPITFLIIMTIFTVFSLVDTVFVHVRYTMIALPFMIILSAFVIREILSFQKITGIVLLLVYLFTNILSLDFPLRSYLYYLAQEIHNPYPTPYELVSNYLKKHARSGDTVFTTYERDHEPLIFLLGNKIKFINRVTLTNTRIFPNNRNIIPRYIYDFRDKPDWVLLFSKRGNDHSFFTFDYRPIPPEIDLKNEYSEVQVIPVFFSDLSRPEFPFHTFHHIRNPVPDDMVYIYKKASSR